ncbi:MAG: glycosyltransferase family 4 protein [Deltaproteobacteria bacterium]|nr:glycosyltransferase family 4 protein [Deltaproteobacteria bacterium]
MKKGVCMILYSWYPTDMRVRREAETLQRDGRFEVTVLALKQYKTPRQYGMNGVSVKELDVEKYTGRSRLKYLVSYLRFMYLSFLRCAVLTLRGRVHVVHVHNMPNFLVFSALPAKILGKKIILDIHDSVPETFLAKFGDCSGALFKLLCLEERICCALADRVVCVNHVQRAVLVRRGIPRSKTFIAMNFPDEALFVPGKRKEVRRDRPGAFRMVYHGTITERLGIDLGIQAVHGLSAAIPKLEFHIWGGGDVDYVAYCVELARKLGVGDRIFFNQVVPMDILWERIKGMDLGVVLNKKNAATELMLPVKLLEYVALGVPVVAPRLKTIQYYFSNGTISYFEPGNLDSLTGVILRTWKDRSRRKRQAQSAKSVLEKYGWHKRRHDFVSFYDCLGQRRKP